MRIKFAPIKPIGNQRPPALADIFAHTNDIFKDGKFGASMPYFHEMYVGDKFQKKRGGSDIMTQGHETCHGVNNDIANKAKGRDKNVGLYGLDDIGFVIDEPNTTIQAVARKVPQEWRGGICKVYDLYLVKQAASWGNRPLYLADEWFAYTAGSVIALQAAKAGDSDPNRWSELQNAIYFNMFMAVEYSILRKNDAVFEMMTFNLKRVDEIFKASQSYPTLVRQETTELLTRFYGHEFYKPFAGADKLPDYGFEEYL